MTRKSENVNIGVFPHISRGCGFKKKKSMTMSLFTNFDLTCSKSACDLFHPTLTNR